MTLLSGSMIALWPMKESRKSRNKVEVDAELTIYSKEGYAPDYFTLRSTYLQGRPPKSVNMHWRRFATSSIPTKDPKAFETWVLDRWKEKDALLEQFYNTGRFPSDETKDGYIETEVRLQSWLEVGQIFVVLGALALVANVLAKLWEMMT